MQISTWRTLEVRYKSQLKRFASEVPLYLKFKELLPTTSLKYDAFSYHPVAKAVYLCVITSDLQYQETLALSISMIRQIYGRLSPRVIFHCRNDFRGRFSSKPLHLYRVVLAEFPAIVPQLEANVCRSQRNLNDIFNSVVFCSSIPPMSVFELEL
jgi:hypothetical protein